MGGWEALWDVFLKSLKDDSAGDLFERFTQLYLQTHPEYRIKLNHAWRCPEDVPLIMTVLRCVPLTWGMLLAGPEWGRVFDGFVRTGTESVQPPDVMIEGWGEAGQEKLKRSTVFIADAGGLGSPVLIYLQDRG